MAKISGPLLDRFDIHLEVPALSCNDLMGTANSEPSAAIKKRASQSRAIASKRLDAHKISTNAHMPHRLLKAHCALDPACRHLLKESIDKLGLSARAHDKILKVARTIADLAQSNDIQPPHLAEAIGYRTLDLMG